MWGKTRRATVYYQCQVTHQRSARIPPHHPPIVYVGEGPLSRAVLGFLAEAVFGPGREEYWRHNLTVAQEPDRRAPALALVEELTAEIGDLEQRLEHQILTLESEESTGALRRRVAERVAHLDGAIRERRDRLAQLAAEVPPEEPQVAAVAEILARLPILADRLPELPQAQLRAIFEGLQLSATYLPDTHEADIEIVLRDDGTAWHDLSQVWSVPPAGFEPAAFRSGGERSIP
jgi:hypothetical protein